MAEWSAFHSFTPDGLFMPFTTSFVSLPTEQVLPSPNEPGLDAKMLEELVDYFNDHVAGDWIGGPSPRFYTLNDLLMIAATRKFAEEDAIPLFERVLDSAYSLTGQISSYTGFPLPAAGSFYFPASKAAKMNVLIATRGDSPDAESWLRTEFMTALTGDYFQVESHIALDLFGDVALIRLELVERSLEHAPRSRISSRLAVGASWNHDIGLYVSNDSAGMIMHGHDPYLSGDFPVLYPYTIKDHEFVYQRLVPDQDPIPDSRITFSSLIGPDWLGGAAEGQYTLGWQLPEVAHPAIDDMRLIDLIAGGGDDAVRYFASGFWDPTADEYHIPDPDIPSSWMTWDGYGHWCYEINDWAEPGHWITFSNGGHNSECHVNFPGQGYDQWYVVDGDRVKVLANGSLVPIRRTPYDPTFTYPPERPLFDDDLEKDSGVGPQGDHGNFVPITFGTQDLVALEARWADRW